MKKLNYDIFMLFYNKYPSWARDLQKYTGWDADLIEKGADYMDKVLSFHETDYYERVFPQVQQEINKFIKEFPEEFKQERRHTYLIFKSLETGKPVYKDNVERARQVPLVDFLRFRGLIKRNEYMIKCPFHNDRTPSLDTRKNFYYCYGCGVHGDTIDFVMRYDNLSFKQAVNLLNRI